MTEPVTIPVQTRPQPIASRVLAVTARPGQESADLGGLLFAFRRSGASLSLLCLTQNEDASPWEVQQAAATLGVREVSVADYRCGNLHHYRSDDLADRIKQAAVDADLLLVKAPETGDIADAAVARAATAAALQAGLPLLARTRAGVIGSWQLDLGTDTEVARAIQKSAAAEHTTQAEALLSRLDEDEDGRESMRWLVSPARLPGQRLA